jgi:ACS family hexuronate transporter-like MFS transporter
MSVVVPDLRVPARSRAWIWWVCGLLLLATMVNYMDRLTLNQLAPRIKAEMALSPIDYSWLEFGFGVAFAVGAIAAGWFADRINVYWLFPAAVLAWSAAGFTTGYAVSFMSLLICRVWLGLAESANWPCALRTTQQLLPSSQRTMGNSILQSGAAVGAIFIPMVTYVLADPNRPGSWRLPFVVVGACGATWAALWMVSVRPRNLHGAHHGAPESAHHADAPRSGGWVAVRRGCALIVLVVMINATWHFFRAWLPLLLSDLGYSQWESSVFMSVYYLAAGAGCLAAGFAALVLTRCGLPVHHSRLVVFLGFGLLTTAAWWVSYLPPGPLLLGLLLVVGFGALGVFPAYYSFSQELTVKHQGKLTGMLGFLCWTSLAGWQVVIGHVVEYTKSYRVCMILSGLFPLVGFVALAVLWGKDEPRAAEAIMEPVPDLDGSPAEPSTGVRAAGAVDGVLASQVRGVTH